MHSALAGEPGAAAPFPTRRKEKCGTGSPPIATVFYLTGVAPGNHSVC